MIRELLPSLERPFLTYGIETDCDFRAQNLRADGLRTHFDVRGPRAPALLGMPGHHNVLNAMACIAVAVDLGVRSIGFGRLGSV